MNKPRNPFIIGKYVSKEYFCDRKQEVKTLAHHVENGRNVTIMSERRLGKTGLIEHMFANGYVKKYHTFLIDIYTCKNLREMVFLLANEVFRKLAKKRSLLERLLDIVKSIQTTVTYNVVTGEPEVGLRLGEITTPEATLDEILAYMEGADMPCVVAIDEFQKITSFEEDDMEALLRTKIQRLKNTQFIFAGSERHLLEGIFSNPERPFYNSVVFMQLQPIDKGEYIRFAQKMFKMYNKSIQKELASAIYDYFKGVTWYLQLSMNEAFTMVEQGSEIGMEAFSQILTNMVDTKRFTFEDRYATLTERQKSVLLAIAAEYPTTPTLTSKDFIVKHNLKTASSVQTAVKGLTEKGLLSEQNGTKQVTDILFLLWLRNY